MNPLLPTASPPSSRRRPLLLAGPVKMVDGLQPTLHRLRPFKFLGRGSFGNVFSILDPSDGINYALKCIRIPGGVRASVVQEVHISMKLLKHENIVQIKGAWPETIQDFDHYLNFVGLDDSRGSSQFPSQTSSVRNLANCELSSSLPPELYLTHGERDVMFIKMELCDHSLEDVLKSGIIFEVREIKSILAQLLSVLGYLREAGVIHNDIRPANVLFKDSVLKLADFGMAILRNNEEKGVPKMSNQIDFQELERSSPYKSPELCFMHPQPCYKSDIFSVGAVIFRLLSTPEDKGDVWHLLNGKEKVDQLFSKLRARHLKEMDLVNVVQRMVSTFPKDRPEMIDSDLAKFMVQKDSVQNLMPLSAPEIDLPSQGLDIVSRKEWGARRPKREPDLHSGPSSLVVIIQYGEKVTAARTRVANHIFLPNIFVVGGNGRIYEARGWNDWIIGAHTGGYNENSVGICLMGDFRLHLPPQIQLDATKRLIQQGVDAGHIIPSYKLYGHWDLRLGFESPGEYLYQEISRWPNKAPTKFPFVETEL